MKTRYFGHWAQVLVGCLLLGLGASSSPGSPGLTTEPDATVVPDCAIRVVSFNVRYGTADDGENSWEPRRELVKDTIAALAPDILCTQEVLNFQTQYIRETLPDYGFVGVGRDDGQLYGEMCAIFFNGEHFEKLTEGHFWLSETPSVVASKSWDAALTRMVSWVALRPRSSGGRAEPGEQAHPHGRTALCCPDTLFVFNTHFDHQGKQARLESARVLKSQVEKIRVGKPAIIAGDFNAPADGKEEGPYRVLVGEVAEVRKAGSARDDKIHGTTETVNAYLDTYRQCHPEPTENEGTFNGFTGRSDGPRIDWILVTPDLEMSLAGIDRGHRGGRYPSDHFPVFAAVRMAQRAE